MTVLFVFDDEVPTIETVGTAVRHDVTGLPRLVGAGVAEQVGRAPAVDAHDGVRNVHGDECGITVGAVSGMRRNEGVGAACV